MLRCGRDRGIKGANFNTPASGLLDIFIFTRFTELWICPSPLQPKLLGEQTHAGRIPFSYSSFCICVCICVGICRKANEGAFSWRLEEGRRGGQNLLRCGRDRGIKGANFNTPASGLLDIFIFTRFTELWICPSPLQPKLLDFISQGLPSYAAHGRAGLVITHF